MLIEWLPPGGPVTRSATGSHWIERDYFLADIRDTALLHRTEWLRAHSDHAVPDPPLTHRPGQATPEEKRAVSWAVHDELMAQIRG